MQSTEFIGGQDIMINQVSSSDVRAVHRSAHVATTTPTEGRMHRYGVGGGLLGATWFGALFPLAITALVGSVSAADAAVYVACGAIFGVVTGGSIGAVIGGRGR